MIIDFHAHIFTDALAPKAQAALIENSHHAYSHCTDMTERGLLAYMDAHGIDISVVLPIVTKPHQTATINNWAASVNGDRHLRPRAQGHKAPSRIPALRC